jgi:hypothetical protein
MYPIETSEKLPAAIALSYYSRMRFIINLLPQLQQAPGIRRVVTCFVGAKEGEMDINDITGRHVPILKVRGHGATVATLGLEAMASRAPDVTFIHNFPGAVNTNLLDTLPGLLSSVLKVVNACITKHFMMEIDEAGERHVFLLTSARYPPRKVDAPSEKDIGVTIPAGTKVVKGTDGKPGSGVYSLEGSFENAGPKVEKLLADYRTQGMVEKVWERTLGEFVRITGKESV